MENINKISKEELDNMLGDNNVETILNPNNIIGGETGKNCTGSTCRGSCQAGCSGGCQGSCVNSTGKDGFKLIDDIQEYK